MIEAQPLIPHQNAEASRDDNNHNHGEQGMGNLNLCEYREQKS
jgi:hypothetical protein